MDPISPAVLDKLRSLGAPLLAFEALWDGDTEGWHLCLFAVVWRPSGKYESVFLQIFEEPGGDFRVFKNLVPPWNESEKASALGKVLSAQFAVPFHFPAPDWPELDCAHWWELASSFPCRDCGIPLVQRDPCPWRGQCYRCHLAAEQARKAALLTPEERAGPRCHVCGRPASGTVRSRPRCEGCLQKYEDYSCSVCQCWTMILRTEPHTDRCFRCEMVEALRQLAPGQRDAIVEAGKRSIPFGIEAVRSVLRCDLGDARFAVQLLLDGEV